MKKVIIIVLLVALSGILFGEENRTEDVRYFGLSCNILGNGIGLGLDFSVKPIPEIAIGIGAGSLIFISDFFLFVKAYLPLGAFRPYIAGSGGVAIKTGVFGLPDEYSYFATARLGVQWNITPGFFLSLDGGALFENVQLMDYIHAGANIYGGFSVGWEF